MIFSRKYIDEDFIKGLCSNNYRIMNRWEEKTYDYFKEKVDKINMMNYSEDKFNSVFQDAINDFIINIKIGKFKGDSSLSTYFSKIFKNKSIDYDRKKKEGKLVDMPDELYNAIEWSVEGEIEIKLTEEAVKDILNQLKGNCKKVITMFLEGYEDKDIATAIGKKTEATKKNRQKCYREYTEFVNQYILA